MFYPTAWHQHLIHFPFSQLSLSRCSELYADWQPRTKKACVSLLDELRQKSARHGYHGRQQLCEGNFSLKTQEQSLLPQITFLKVSFDIASACK